MKLDELMQCSAEELVTKFKSNEKLFKYKHDMAVLFGSLGISPSKYETLMKTLTEIDTFGKVEFTE